MNLLQLSLACTVIKLIGSSENDVPLVDEVAPYVSQNPCLVIDASQIVLGSMQIGELVNLAEQFHDAWQNRAHHLAIINLSSAAKDALTITRLDKIIPMYDDLPAALSAFERGGIPRSNVQDLAAN